MIKHSFWVAATLGFTVGIACAQTTIIGAGGSIGVPSSGNGNFEAKTGAIPAANTTWPISEMPNWHNLSGAESQTCGANQGFAGSPEVNSYGAYLFPSFVIGNDVGYTITNAGQTFDVSLALNKFGSPGNYSGDEAVVVRLFTSTTGVTDSTVVADTTVLATAAFTVDVAWTPLKSTNAFYTTTAGDIGKTVYLGLTLSNPTTPDVFPRVDVVKLVVSAGATNPPAGPIIIGGSIGNGDFEDGEPAASGAVSYENTIHWFNASGAETLNFTQDDQTGGSSQPNSRAGMPFQNRKQVNDSGHLVASAGETFNLSYDFGRGGTGWDNDESLRTFLFTATAPVDGNLTVGNMTEFASVVYPIPSTPQWTTFTTNGFYITTAGDVGKTFYFGMEMNNPAGADVFPRIDVIQWTVAGGTTNAPSGPNAWQEFVNRYGLSGDKTADQDGDGQLDYQEFIHGGNPTNATDLATRPYLTYSNGVAIYHTVETGNTNPGVPFTAEWTANLASGQWTNTWDSQTNAPAAISGYNDVVRKIAGGTNQSIYCRVRPLNSVKRPNILVVLADDLGYADVSFNVQGTPDIPTPNIDKLAKAGTIFTSAYVVHPFCGPSRMGLFTGRYPHAYGAPFNLPDWSTGDYQNQGMPTSETTISTVLKNSGYFTGIVGKWHLGREPQHHPNNRGFDEFWGFLGGGHNYFGPYSGTSEYGGPPEYNGTNVTTLTANDYMTDVLSTQGINFLNKAMTKTNPFFLFVSYNAPHMPNQAKQSDLDLFPNLTGNRKIKAAMINAIDRGVSNIVATLKANGQFANTLIVFLSDNGGITADGSLNTPLQGNKGDVWDGGFRVPMFMHLPNVIPAGQTYDHPVTALDFYPTFTHLAGTQIPPGKVIDGKDIWNDVVHTRNARPGGQIYTVRYNIGSGANGVSNVGIRQDQWKAVRWFGANWKLFNITNDIGETTDLSATYPAVLSSLVLNAKNWATNTHITPIWFDNNQAGLDWISKGMPHYDTTFSLP